jgi:hypothetical protein
MFAMKSQVSALHNRRRILFLLCGGIGLCATNSIDQIGYAQPVNNFPKLKTSFEPVQSFCNELTSFEEKIKKAKQKSGNISDADKTVMKNQAKLVISKISNAQSSTKEIIKELKSTNQWNKNLDTSTEEGLRKNGADARFISYISQQGGIRVIMENAISSSMTSEISAELESKLKSINASQSSFLDILIPPASARCIKCNCYFYVLVASFCLGFGAIPCSVAAVGAGAACVTAET